MQITTVTTNTVIQIVLSYSHCLAMCVSALLGDAVPSLEGSMVPAPHSVDTLNAVLDTQAQYWPILAPFRASTVPHIGVSSQARCWSCHTLGKCGSGPAQGKCG